MKYALCIASVVLALDLLGQTPPPGGNQAQTAPVKKRSGAKKTKSTDDKKATSPRDQKATQSDKTPPSPGTPVPAPCATLTLQCQTPAPAKKKAPTTTPPAAFKAVAVYPLKEGHLQNAASIAAELKDEANFKFVPDGNSRIIVFCKIKACTEDSKEVKAVERIIDQLSEPPKVRARGVNLPFFCLSGKLHGPQPQRIDGVGCGPEGRVQGSNAADIETALSKDASFTVKAEGANRVLVSCKKDCTELDFARIRDEISELARPAPAYIEDQDVPEGRAADIATKINALKLMGVTADAIGSAKVRLKSDTPVSESDVIAIIRPYLFGGQVPPAFRMFYQSPGVVVPAMAPPPSGGSGGTPGGSSTPSSTTASSTTPSSTTPSSATPSNAAAPAASSTAAPGTAPASTTVTFTTKSDTSTSVTPPAQTAGSNATDASAADATTTGSTAKPASPTTTTTSTTTTITPPPPPAPAPAPTPAPAQIGAGMAPVVDNVVFTDTSNDALVWQRVRLLTMLDLPRPEVLMNVWSYQASSPDGNEVLRRSEQVRDLVSAHNDALENSIQYGWAYLSRQMNQDALHQVVETDTPELKEREPYASSGRRSPEPPTQNLPAGAPGEFFDREFYDYITQKFVGDPDGSLDTDDRTRWGFCPVAKYCLGYTHAFQPVRPNLTSILMGAMAASHPLSTILTTIGCMEGKYEVYGRECFPDRVSFNLFIQQTHNANKELQYTRTSTHQKNEPLTDKHRSSRPCGTIPECQEQLKGLGKQIDSFKSKVAAGECRECEKEQAYLQDEQVYLETQVKALAGQTSKPEEHVSTYQEAYADDIEAERSCLRLQRRKLMSEKPYKDRVSCEVLDAVALDAQETCRLAQTLPLSCFTIEAAQAFSSPTSFSTFTLKDLNEIAEEPIARSWVVTEGDDRPANTTHYGTTRIGLLRAAVADFLFNYKMSQEFPRDFTPYDLQHSAQELNAELNPLVVAFNQDVAAYSQHLSDKLDVGSSSFPQLWRNHRSFLSDGIITVRGIGGVQSTVDTTTQNFFDATQAQSLSAILNNFTGQGAAGSASGTTASPTASVLSALQAGTLNPTTAIAALAAIVPQATKVQIGRAMSFYVTPYTLPGASSAELQVQLTVGDSAEPTLYQAGNATGAIDTVSHVAQHNVSTRVRVESVKLFELSSFSALLQRPRAKFPLVPPFVELPLIGSVLSVPLPGAKEYHRSTAIVSAVIVPTATDLAYGIDFAHDRLITNEEKTVWGRQYEMRSVGSLSDFSRAPIHSFHKAMVNCLATHNGLTASGGVRSLATSWFEAQSACRDLDFRNVPPEF